MHWLKPTKKSVLASLILGILYIGFVYVILSGCTMAGLVCSEKPHHDVPSMFPGSTHCQVCATSSELLFGYAQMIFLYYVVPLAIIYVLSSLSNIRRSP